MRIIRAFRSLSQYTRPFLSKQPQFDATTQYISKAAHIIGDVQLKSQASVYPGCVLRGDIQSIVIGEKSNIQDNTVIHVTSDLPCIIGQRVSVGHGCILHACTVDDDVLVGMGSILLDGCHIGKESIVAAGSIVPMNKHYPPRSLIMGSPASVKRRVTDEEIVHMKTVIEKYIQVSQDHLEREQQEREI